MEKEILSVENYCVMTEIAGYISFIQIRYLSRLGLWLKVQASYGRRDPRKLDRKAAVIMA